MATNTSSAIIIIQVTLIFIDSVHTYYVIMGVIDSITAHTDEIKIMNLF